MTDRAIDVGQPAPPIEVADLSGRKLLLGGAREDGRSQLFLFVSPRCPMCKKLLGVAKSFMRRERRHLWLALIGDGERGEQERFVRAHKLEAFPYIVSPVVGMTYQVGKLPYAVLIDEAGIVRAKGLVNSREHLESLLVAKETGYASIQEYLDASAPESRPTVEMAAVEGLR
jgi:methylamine dehydrogenase accessory protein MauD